MNEEKHSEGTDAEKPTSVSEVGVDVLVNWFSDESIIDQDTALIQNKDGKKVLGIILMVETPIGVQGTEICLEYSELKKCIEYLEKDLDAHKAMGFDVS